MNIFCSENECDISIRGECKGRQIAALKYNTCIVATRRPRYLLMLDIGGVLNVSQMLTSATRKTLIKLIFLRDNAKSAPRRMEAETQHILEGNAKALVAEA